MLIPARLKRLFAVLILALLLGGCSSTKLAESWEAPDIDEPPAGKILLVALIKDPVTKRFFEEHFVEEAKKKGVEVIPSYEYMPNATDSDEKEEIVSLVNKLGVEGVLVAQLKGVHKDYKYVPSRLDWFPDAYSSMFFYDYYYQSYRAIYRPGYVGSDNYFSVQLRYFSAKSEKMLWAANTVTKNPRSVVGTIEQIADEVLGDLTSSSLVKAKGFIQRKLDQGDDA
ncbi:hypothetical protein [Thiolapillus sp.]